MRYRDIIAELIWARFSEFMKVLFWVAMALGAFVFGYNLWRYLG
jgi:hypothetical protein